MLALKIEFMEVFVTGVRKEIVELQNELMLGEEEREAFGAFWDCEFTVTLSSEPLSGGRRDGEQGRGERRAS